MTVSATTPVTGPTVADGITRLWPFVFKVFSAADIKLLVSDADGSNTAVITTGFTVDPSYLNNDAGGYIVYPVDPVDVLTAGKIVSVYRDVPYAQEIKIGNQGGFFPADHERMADYLSMQIQQLAEVSSRSIAVPFGSLPPDGDELLESIASAIAAEGAAQGYAAAALLSQQIAAGYASSAVSQGNVPVYATAAVIPALTIPAGIGAFETQGYSAIGDAGDALYKRATGTPSATLGRGRIQSADGAWWTFVARGPIRIEQMGGKADWNGATGTDNWPAIMDAFAQVTVGSGFYKGGPEVVFQPGTYHFNQAVELKKIVKLKGIGPSGQASAIGLAILHFPIDCHGIVINRFDTLNGAVEGTPTTAADGSAIEGLRITSAGGTDTSKAGIWGRARSILRDLVVDHFPGNGIQLIGTGNGAGAAHGNCNETFVETVSCESNGGHGFMTQGADANAGTFIKVGVRGNKKCGIYENSFLGNLYLGCHFDTGSLNSTAKGRVAYGGRLYQLLLEGTIGGLTTPGTNSAVWYDNGADAGGATGAPAWASGGAYEVDGPIWAGSNNSQAIFIGTYIEPGWGISHLTKPAIAIGGGPWTLFTCAMGASLTGWQFLGGGILQGSPTTTAAATYGAAVNARLGGSADLGQILNFDNTLSGAAWRLKFLDAYTVAFNTNNQANSIMKMYAAGSRFKGGRVTEILNAMVVSNLVIGDGATGRRVHFLTAVPATGVFARGEIILNSNPSVGAPDRWVCTTGGAIAASAWVASTAVALDTVRSNGGNNYVCTTAGTTAASGGPAGTGTAIADGTAVWDYVPAYVFTASANL